MVRYEGAALIVAAFIMDMIESPNRKARVRAFLWSALASLPLAIWLAATWITWRPDNGHYLEMMFVEGSVPAIGPMHGTSHSVRTHLETLWKVSIQPLLVPGNSPPGDVVKAVWQVSKGAAACGLASALFYGLRRRHPVVLVLVMFAVPYFLVHVAWSYLTRRHYVAIMGMAVVLCWFGLVELRRRIIERFGVQRRLDAVLQACAIGVAVAGCLCLARQVTSPPAAGWRFVCMTVMTLAVAGWMFVRRLAMDGRRALLREGCILASMCLFVLSNQTVLGRVMGDRYTDIEFKHLARWYVENAGPDEKMVTSLSSTVALFVPGDRDRFVHTGSIRADSPKDFVRKCRDQGIIYVVWDSRLGRFPENYHYRLWGLENVAPLAEPVGNDDYEFLTRITVSEERFLNIFRVRPSDGPVSDGFGQDK